MNTRTKVVILNIGQKRRIKTIFNLTISGINLSTLPQSPIFREVEFAAVHKLSSKLNLQFKVTPSN